jgi:hypothetical protein
MQLFSGNYFGLAPKRGWLIWDKMQNHLAMQNWRTISIFLFARSHTAGRNSLQKQHPTQKPVSLMKWCIELKPANHHRSFCWIGTTGGSRANVASSQASSATQPISKLPASASSKPTHRAAEPGRAASPGGFGMSAAKPTWPTA